MDLLQEFLVEQLLDESLESVFNDYYQTSMSRELFDKVIALDPTFDITKDKLGEYGKWLLKVVAKKTVPEDEFDQVKDVLSVFDEQKTYLRASGMNDINRFKTLKDIRDALAAIELTPNQLTKINRKKRRSTDYGDGAEFIAENDDWEIWSPTTQEAAMKLGHATDWCTAMTRPNINFFELYTSDVSHNQHISPRPAEGEYGRLFAFIPKSEKAKKIGKYQAQVVYSSGGAVKYMGDFKDASDHGNPGRFARFVVSSGTYDIVKDTDMAKTSAFKGVEAIQTITRTHKISVGRSGFYNLLRSDDDITLNDDETRVQRDFLFSDEDSIKEIIIENSTMLKEFDSRIFSAFKKIESIKFVGPSTIETITSNTFFGIVSLKTIVLPQTLKIISKEAFRGCTNLGEIILPDTLTFIGYNAFDGCPKLILKMNRRGKHNKLQVPASNLSILKNRLVYIGEEEQVKEESLKLDESFSPSMPPWLKRWLTKRTWDSASREVYRRNGMRVALTGDTRSRGAGGNYAYYSNLIKKNPDIEQDAEVVYIDLNKANFVSIPVPTNARDEHLKSPYIPIYHLSYKYMGGETNRVLEDVYIPGVNDSSEPEWDSEDKIYKRYSVSTILSHTVDFCYLDSRDVNNYISPELRKNRVASQAGSVNRMTPNQIKQIKRDRSTNNDVADKSGYLLDPSALITKLNTYSKEHYATSIKGYYKRLTAARSELQKILSSVDINTRRTDEDVVQSAYSNLFSVLYIYRAFKNDVEDALKISDKVEREAKLNRLFSDANMWSSRNTIATLRNNLVELERLIKEISLVTLESLE